MIEIAILGILDEHELHGYELKKQMEALAGAQGGVSFGSLYPALNRLERNNHVSAVDPTKSKLTSTFTGPMTGAITGELAALRQRRKTETTSDRRSGRKNRKVYAISSTGRARLHELLLTADPSDARTFSLQVAFCRHIRPSERLELFERRRSHLNHKLNSGLDRDALANSDPYRRSLRAHDTLTLNHELDWIDELIAITRGELGPTPSTHVEVPITTGGSHQ